MGVRAAVAGGSGYAGGELLRLLAAHPDLELGVVTADSNAGRPVGEVHPHLAGLPAVADRSFEVATAQSLSGHDVVFLAMPAGRSAAVVALAGRETRIVDLGPDFRLGDATAWARHYPGRYPGRWVTGLPEMPGARPEIRAATRVAVPGCYATAAILALAPLAAAGLIELGDIVIVAASGTSGAGRAARQDLLGSEVMGAVSAYQAGGAHRHVPEIEQALDEAASGGSGVRARVSFTPVLAPMPRGILAVCTAPLLPEATGPALRDAVAMACSGEPFLTLLPDGRWPTTAAVAGSNGVHLQAAADARAGRAVVVAAIDNLGKGAAGQAVQNANLMFGLPETAGLTACGVAP